MVGPTLSTYAPVRQGKTFATLPYASRLAERGINVMRGDPGFAKGVNVYHGAITCRAVAEALGKLDQYQELKL